MFTLALYRISNTYSSMVINKDNNGSFSAEPHCDRQFQFTELLKHHQNTQFLHTDGLKKAELVGCAVASRLQIIQHVLPSSLSIFSAKLQAILLATQHITQNFLPWGVICTNSLSAIQALSLTRQVHHPILSAIRETVSRKQVTLKIISTPSHCGILGNKLINWVAKEAAKW